MSIVTVLTQEIRRLQRRCTYKQRRILALERSRAMWKARAQAKHGSFGRHTGTRTRFDKAA